MAIPMEKPRLFPAVWVSPSTDRDLQDDRAALPRGK
jgi:hypothetical protein